MKICAIAIMLCMAGLLCSCTRIRDGLDTTPLISVRPVPDIVKVEADEFRVGVGDYLEIAIRSNNPEDDLGEYAKIVFIQPSGRIAFLYNDVTGDIKVDGLTTDEIAKLIYKELVLKKGIKPGATITVMLASIRSRTVSIMGEVKNPGPLMIVEPLTLVEALSRAGGFTEFADMRGILLIRREGSQEITYKFNYKYWVSEQGDSKYVNMQLKPGDIIVVPEQ